MDLRDNAIYAIKELAPTALFRAKERRRAESGFRAALDRWQQLSHPALVRIAEDFVESDKYYVVFEWVDGLSLRRIIENPQLRVNPLLTRRWGAALCDLMTYLHQQDPPVYTPFLSPGHVMVTTQGRIKLVDLGLTHLFSPTGTGLYGSVRGYAAPDLELAPPTVATDLFALGRLLYALLTDKLLEKLTRPSLPLRRAVPGIDERLVKAIARAANRNPQQRPASAAELRQALLEGQPEAEPDEDWLDAIWHRHKVPAASATERTGATRSGYARVESMADLGFERDPRFGPSPVGAAPAPRMAARERQAAPATGAPQLSVHPRSFVLKDLDPTQAKRVVLSVHNTGDGDLTGRVSSRLPWIGAPARTFTLPPSKRARVIVSVHGSQAPAGQTFEPQAISIETNAGRQWVAVKTDIPTGPSLRVEPSQLDYGTFADGGDRTLTLTLRNSGRQSLSASIVSRVPWLQVRTPQVRCNAGDSVGVSVALLTQHLPRGPQELDSALLVESNAGQERVAARAWRVRAELDLDTTRVDMGTVAEGAVSERALTLRNTGDGQLEGNVRPLVPWLQAHPSRFDCAPGDMVAIALIADATGLPDGPLEIPQAVRVQTNVGVATLGVKLRAQAPRLELGTARLDFGVVPLGQSPERALVIRNTGSVPLTATVHPLVDWLVLGDENVVCEPGAQISVPVRAETARLNRGEEIVLAAGLRVTSGASFVDVPVSLAVLQPALRVEPQEIDFGYVERAQPETRTLTISNDGTGRLAWNAQTDAVWVEVSPSQGACERDETQTLTLTAYGLALEPDTEAAESTLVINSDGGRIKLPLRVAIASPVLATDTTLVDLGVSRNRANLSGGLRLFNHGLGPLRGTISSDQTWLVVDRASFECATGRSVEIGLSTDMVEYPPGADRASALLRIASNGGIVDVEVLVEVALVSHLQMPDAVVLTAGDDSDPSTRSGGQGRLVINNTGLAAARAELRTSTPQLTLSRNLFDIKPGKSVRIAVRWSPLSGQGASASEGPHDEGLYVDVVSDDEEIRVPVMWSEAT